MDAMEYGRQLKVTEINRLLPMVRETIKARKKVIEIEKPYKELCQEERTLKESIQKAENFKELVQRFDIPEKIFANGGKERIISVLQQKLKKTEIEIEKLNERQKKEIEQQEVLEEKIEIENILYLSIIDFIDHEVYLRKEEIQEEYYMEYVYIMWISGFASNGQNLMMKELFENQEDFKKILKEKAPILEISKEFFLMEFEEIFG